MRNSSWRSHSNLANARSRGLGALAAAIVVLAACGGSGSSTGGLASDQTLRFPIFGDVGTLDPALANTQTAINIDRNLFNGLYTFDTNGKLVPDLATGMPTVSSDNLTYTIHIRTNAKFSNGDHVTANDVVYSWTRSIKLQGEDALLFTPIVGYDQASKGGALTGMTASDNSNVVIKLQATSGPFSLALGDMAVAVVDQKVVTQLGDNWWTTPDGMVGSGPFKMSARTPKQSLDFVPVSGWWNGSAGNLKHVHIDVFSDNHAEVLKYQSGGEDLVGGDLHADPTVADTLLFQKSATTKSEVHIYPTANSGYVGFNWTSGPFAGDAGTQGRLAFSQAVDRKQLVQVVCANVSCVAATGGVVPPAVPGYLGDNSDPVAKFDPAAAKAAYQQWDPTGSKVKGLTLYTYTIPVAKTVAEFLQSQWQANLGIKVDVQVVDLQAYVTAAFGKKYSLFVLAQLQPLYPSFYYENFGCGTAGPGGSNPTGWCNKQYDSILAQADQLPLDQALPMYKQAADILAQQVPFGPTYYTTTTLLIKPYVRGAGRGTAYLNSWTQISILQH